LYVAQNQNRNQPEDQTSNDASDAMETELPIPKDNIEIGEEQKDYPLL
jgi:hypothetical protein